MPNKKKLNEPVTLFAQIESEVHKQLRLIAYNQRKSVAKVVRQAIAEYLKNHKSI